VELANDINSHMPDYVAHRLLKALNERGLPVKGSRVLLLGLAYKKNTGDARESPAIRVAELLDEAEDIVNSVAPGVIDDVQRQRDRATGSGIQRLRGRFRRKR